MQVLNCATSGRLSASNCKIQSSFGLKSHGYLIYSEDLSKISLMVIGATSFSERERKKGKKYAKHENGFHTDSLFIMVTASLFVNHHYIILQL